MRRVLGLGIVALLVAAAAALPVDAAPAPTVLTVDLGTDLGDVNRRLVGFGHHQGGQPLTAVEPLDPAIVRIDASLQDVSPSPGVLQVGPLLERVAEVRAVGAQPLVILSYMPAWLGQPRAYGRDPTRVAPADLDAWQGVVHDVVHALATAPSPARRFEAWNEPDIPIFWQDTPQAWADTVARSAAAISMVEEETGIDLHFGGPATAFPDPVYLQAFLSRVDPDFVSWHYYGNTPFFGPDGNEFDEAALFYPVVGRRNPVASPAAYGPQVEMMRSWTEAMGGGKPKLVLDEWNLSPGGYDVRHDTNEGAAFAAGVLVEMQEAGVDASAFFRATDTHDVPGDHGAVKLDGTRKPVWWTFALWQQLAPERVPVDGASDDDGLWAIAAKGDGVVTVLVASFSASDPVDRVVEIAGLPSGATITVQRLGEEVETLDEPRFDLPAQSVALVTVRS